jgi:hypothetical protein
MDGPVVEGTPTPDPRVERVLGLLGLARRAGKLALGATAVEKQVRHGPPPVVIIAHDAGGNQRSRVKKLGPVRGVIDGLLGRDDLAGRLGRNELVVVAVNDPGFVRGLFELGVVAEPRDGSAAS